MRFRYHYTQGYAISIVIGLIAFAIPVLLTLFAIVSAQQEGQRITKSIGSIYTSAQNAPNSEAMVERLNLVLSNLEKEGLTEGRTYGFSTRPGNDQAVAYADIKLYRDRAQELMGTQPNTADSATNLQDIRYGLDATGVAWAAGVYWHSWQGWVAAFAIPIWVVAGIASYHLVYKSVDYAEHNRRLRKRRQVVPKNTQGV